MFSLKQATSRSPDTLLFPPRSMRCLQLCHPKRCVPNRGAWLRQPANAQNCDALTVPLNPMSSVPIWQDYAHRSRIPLCNVVPWLIREYHSALLLVRSLLQSSPRKRLYQQHAIRVLPQNTNTIRRERQPLRPETLRLRAPDLKTTRRVSPRDLKIAQIVVRHCQNEIASYD